MGESTLTVTCQNCLQIPGFFWQFYAAIPRSKFGRFIILFQLFLLYQKGSLFGKNQTFEIVFFVPLKYLTICPRINPHLHPIRVLFGSHHNQQEVEVVEVEMEEEGAEGAEEVEIVEVEILLSVAMLILTRSSEQRTDHLTSSKVGIYGVILTSKK